MAQNGDVGRSRTASVANTGSETAEERAIQTMMYKGEQDLALKREARARARMLRTEELQRQKENEEQEGNNGASTRLKKQASAKMELEDDLPEDPGERLMAINSQLRDTLLVNSQLHSDKMQLVYQLDLCKDRLEDGDQDLVELRHYNRTNKQDLAVSQHQLRLNEQQVARLRQEVEARDAYLKEKEIQWPPPEKPEELASAGEATPSSNTSEAMPGNGDLSLSRASSTEDLGPDDKKRRVDSHTREKQYLLEQIGRLKQEVILLKNELESQALSSAATKNGGLIDGRELMRDTARLLSEYKSKLLAVETDKTRLEGQLQRADAQVKRLRTQREDAEKLEDELKSDRRKLQRDVRSAESKAEELELENERLQKRIEALRKRHQKD